jgi:hypothetical protein
MPRTNDQLRKIVNMLSDERQAPVALNILRAEAEERRVLVSDLMASLATPQPEPQPQHASEPPASTDSIDITVGRKINHAAYGLRSEIRRETEKAWLVASPVGGPEIWLPKSQVEFHGEDPIGRAIFIVPMWLARTKGFV